MSWSVYAAVPLMAILAVIQAAILPYFTIFGLSPQLLLIFALAWGLLRGPEDGAAWAFIAGIFLDLFSATPMGVSSLALMVGVVAASFVLRSLPSSRFVMPVVLAAMASLIYLLLYLLLLRLTGYPVVWAVAGRLPLVAVLNSLLVLPVYWLLYTLDRNLRRRKVEI
jgi:rod shape-determining protein MreD